VAPQGWPNWHITYKLASRVVMGEIRGDKVYRNLLTSSSSGVKILIRPDVHFRIEMNLIEVDQ
jgi:hypothetical protein